MKSGDKCSLGTSLSETKHSVFPLKIPSARPNAGAQKQVSFGGDSDLSAVFDLTQSGVSSFIKVFY